MGWTWYLFSFEGRINRAKYWLALPVLFGLMFLIVVMMWVIMAGGLLLTRDLHGHEIINVNLSFDEIFSLLGPASRLSLSPREIVSLVGNLFGMTVVMWICLATSVKRLHDRKRSGWWSVSFFVLPVFSDRIAEWLVDSILASTTSAALLILGIWGFVEMGFLRGTEGPNQFGPDPLAEDEDARVRNRGLGSHGTAWDQRNELELAPHRASPMSSMHVKRGA
jgi:uncharacterized membrane protein YhaH (DUF805 family)